MWVNQCSLSSSWLSSLLSSLPQTLYKWSHCVLHTRNSKKRTKFSASRWYFSRHFAANANKKHHKTVILWKGILFVFNVIDDGNGTTSTTGNYKKHDYFLAVLCALHTHMHCFHSFTVVCDLVTLSVRFVRIANWELYWEFLNIYWDIDRKKKHAKICTTLTIPRDTHAFGLDLCRTIALCALRACLSIH